MISDNDYPIQSSTGTLTIRVCACDSRGNMQSCSAEALLLPAGLSTGALVAILLCIIILLGKKKKRVFPRLEPALQAWLILQNYVAW